MIKRTIWPDRFLVSGEEGKEEFVYPDAGCGRIQQGDAAGASKKRCLGVYVQPVIPWRNIRSGGQNCINNTAGNWNEETGKHAVKSAGTGCNAATSEDSIADKTVKYTKMRRPLAFLNVEDLIGNVEVVAFPQV